MALNWIWLSEIKKYAYLAGKDAEKYMNESKEFDYKITHDIVRFNDVCYIRTQKKK